MSDYYMLDCWGIGNDEPTQEPVDADLDDYDENDEIGWLDGRKISIELPLKLKMEWASELSGGGLFWDMYGEPSDGPRNEQGVRRLWAYPATWPPLFHRDIIEAFRACGVDNFDLYETSIKDTVTGVLCDDYFGVNFIGLVKAVSMEESIAVSHSDDGLVDTDFDSVVLDGSATREFKLFRLAECVTALVVHRSVKEHLESKGGFELTFTEPESWAG